MSSKEKEGSVTSNDGDDKKMKEDLQDDMQVLDEVTENDDGTGEQFVWLDLYLECVVISLT